MLTYHIVVQAAVLHQLSPVMEYGPAAHPAVADLGPTHPFSTMVYWFPLQRDQHGSEGSLWYLDIVLFTVAVVEVSSSFLRDLLLGEKWKEWRLSAVPVSPIRNFLIPRNWCDWPVTEESLFSFWNDGLQLRSWWRARMIFGQVFIIIVGHGSPSEIFISYSPRSDRVGHATTIRWLSPPKIQTQSELAWKTPVHPPMGVFVSDSV